MSLSDLLTLIGKILEFWDNDVTMCLNVRSIFDGTVGVSILISFTMLYMLQRRILCDKIFSTYVTQLLDH